MKRIDYFFRFKVFALTTVMATVGLLLQNELAIAKEQVGKPKAKQAEEKKPEITIPITGQRVPAMDEFDAKFADFLTSPRWKIPGAAVAIIYKGKLVFARGYGYADQKTRTAVEPDSLFRLSSISKIFTAAAVLNLVKEGKLTLETKAFPILNLPLEKDQSRRPDPRINQITIRHLLECTAGWDRNASNDPLFCPVVIQAANDYSNTLRPTARAVIRYEYSRPLDFTPGTQFVYSNFEYSVLGEIIAKITGQKYADYVRKTVFEPLGISSIVPGRTREKAAKEVTYYPYLFDGNKGERLGPSVFPNIRGPLPLEYGGDFCLEAMTADCGWVGSVTDTARFVSRLFGDDPNCKVQLLSPELIKEMLARPAIDHWKGVESYFGFGWEIEHTGSKESVVRKIGCLPGAEALVMHYDDGTTIAVAYNGRPWGYAEFQAQSFEMMEQVWRDKKYLQPLAPTKPGKS